MSDGMNGGGKIFLTYRNKGISNNVTGTYVQNLLSGNDWNVITESFRELFDNNANWTGCCPTRIFP